MTDDLLGSESLGRVTARKRLGVLLALLALLALLGGERVWAAAEPAQERMTATVVEFSVRGELK